VTLSLTHDAHGCGLIPSTETVHLPATSRSCSLAVDPARLRLAVEQEQRQRLRSALLSLSASFPDGPRMTYAETLDYEQRTGTKRLLALQGRNIFIPLDLSTETIRHVVSIITPAWHDDGRIRVALYELYLITKHAKMGDDDRNDIVAVYLKRLAGYDRGVTLLVLAEIAVTASFWPSWKELQDAIEAQSGWATQLTTALRMFLQARDKRKLT